MTNLTKPGAGLPVYGNAYAALYGARREPALNGRISRRRVLRGHSASSLCCMLMRLPTV